MFLHTTQFADPLTLFADTLMPHEFFFSAGANNRLSRQLGLELHLHPLTLQSTCLLLGYRGVSLPNEPSETCPMQIALVALAPVVFLFSLIYLKDRYEREPLRLLIFCFLWGILISVPLTFVQSLTGVGPVNFESPHWMGELLYTALVFGLTEEYGKYLVLRHYIFSKSEFSEPYDGIMYGVAISLGFAAIENVLYVMVYGIPAGWLRMFTAVPAHAIFGVMLGYYAGHAKFRESEQLRRTDLAKGYFAAAGAHTVYDLFAFSNSSWSLLYILVVVQIGWKLSARAVREHQEWAAARAADNILAG